MTKKDNPKPQLLKLKKEIISTFVDKNHKKVWFYPNCPKDKRLYPKCPKDLKGDGFEGTKDIIFIGLNPSTTEFPSHADVFLYQELLKHKLQNAHITDFLKIQMSNSKKNDFFDNIHEPKKKQIFQMNVKYLQKEINYLKPLIIVPMGKEVTKLTKLLCKIDENTKIIPMMHYSNFRYPDRKREIQTEIEEISKEYKRIKSIKQTKRQCV
ncbi:MAG: hypothetical protein KAT05_03670 [Spirochaetes bacterium]|nr:hypothetical protein [Spirochaetota bacterium]